MVHLARRGIILVLIFVIVVIAVYYKTNQFTNAGEGFVEGV